MKLDEKELDKLIMEVLSEDFNKGEDYYEIVVNPFWMNE